MTLNENKAEKPNQQHADQLRDDPTGRTEYKDSNGDLHSIANVEDIEAATTDILGEVVNTITGTANQIAVGGTATDPVVELVDNAVLPGNEGVTIPAGTTAQRNPNALPGTIR